MLQGTIQEWLEREWLLTNGRGGYAGSTIIGCPTRRYHGWLVWNRPGVISRWLLWAHAAEHVAVGGRTYLLSNFEFNNAIDPHGYQHIQSFEIFPGGPHPAVEWLYQVGPLELRKRLWLDHGRDCVSVRYTATVRDGQPLRMQVWPLIACREANDLRRKFAGQLFETAQAPAAFSLVNRLDRDVSMCIAAHADGRDAACEFQSRPDWWYNFRYRQEAARGLDCGEDLYVPGSFVAAATGRLELQLLGEAGAVELKPVARECAQRRAAATGAPASAMQADALLETGGGFLIAHRDHGDQVTETILAGYPWLESFSRDACVALPGLLLLTGRHDAARRVLSNMAGLLRDGLLPTHVIHGAEEHEYTAADEPLWFVYAVDAYLAASGDQSAEAAALLAACRDILECYARGTQRALSDGRPLRIAMDPADNLILCGTQQVAGTWMDARVMDRWITPRAGKPIEVNALWHHALRVTAARLARTDPAASARLAALADGAARSFERVFWLESGGYLADLVAPDGAVDASLRPNQLIALALPDSPVCVENARRALSAIDAALLTPMGLRTLAPNDPGYRGRYEGGRESREAARHQGSVYAWLMGFYVDALLRVNGDGPATRARARGLLTPLMGHVFEAGIGGVSGVFEGDPPHAPRGCPFQAWSAGELLRAWRRTAPVEEQRAAPPPRAERAVGAPAGAPRP